MNRGTKIQRPPTDFLYTKNKKGGQLYFWHFPWTLHKPMGYNLRYRVERNGVLHEENEPALLLRVPDSAH
ncbi:MAG: hypothetical protein HC862_07120 [Scytonema sp. RU_4_4]|nr:hypothetical protein [Scytonema sp. RU_4_4]